MSPSSSASSVACDSAEGPAQSEAWTLAGFDPTLRWNDRKTVHEAWVRIEGILKEAGLAALSAQKLSIKLEIVTRPPAGAVCERAIIDRHMTFATRHYDLPSLMAGKIHALSTRRYLKGRDWYDLLWYRARRPPVSPNLRLLQNALDQTQGPRVFDAAEWVDRARIRLAQLDERVLRDDVQPFLERPRDAELLTRENLETVLSGC